MRIGSAVAALITVVAIILGSSAIYVVPEGHRRLLLPEPWDLEHFRRTHLREYVRHCADLSRLSAEHYTPPEERR